MNFGGTIRINRTGIIILLAICIIFIFYNLSSEKNLNLTNRLRSQASKVNLKDLLIAAIEVTILGGKEIVLLQDNHEVQIKGKTKEGADDRVTTADFHSHCVMFKGLQKAFPNVKVISEEKGDCDKEVDLSLSDNVFDEHEKGVVNLNTFMEPSRITIWIDPLDATQEYTEKLTQYVTTMACIAIDGNPIIGVIHNPFTNATSWAWVGKTASKDLQLKQQKSDGKIQPKIIISRSHSGDVEDFLKKAFGDDVEIIKAAGAGYKTLQVAHGSVTAYIHKTSIKKWDLCAGNAIINYLAGGHMTTFQNVGINYANAEKVVNDKGLVTTLKDHDYYIEAIRKIEEAKS